MLRQENLKDESIYDHRRVEKFETEECKAQYPWQLLSYPTCNSLFEFDIAESISQLKDNRILAHGYWRDVWKVNDIGIVDNSLNADRLVFKTMRYHHDFEERNYDRHRRDAVAMERLSKSNLVVNIYAFCGNSGLFEYANGGTLFDAIFPMHESKHKTNLTATERLQSAAQAIMSIAAMHNIEAEGKAAIAHTDIKPSQFVGADDQVFRLNDFNRARFIRKYNNGTSCGYYVGRNPGKNRSPEEYNYEEQSEKVDIYSFGNILYMLLTGMFPFEECSNEEIIQEKVKKGVRPTIPKEIVDSNDPIIGTLKQAMFLCHEQKPEKRASARIVETFLVDKLLQWRPNALEDWGLVEEYESIDRELVRQELRSILDKTMDK